MMSGLSNTKKHTNKSSQFDRINNDIKIITSLIKLSNSFLFQLFIVTPLFDNVAIILKRPGKSRTTSDDDLVFSEKGK